MPRSCKVTTLKCYNNKLTSLNLSGCNQLELLWCHNNRLTDLTIPKYCSTFYDMDFSVNNLSGTAVDAIISNLPKKESPTDVRVYDPTMENEANFITPAQVAAAKARNWRPMSFYIDPNETNREYGWWEDYEGNDGSNILSEQADTKPTPTYTLSGLRQQQTPLPKGLYIKDHKKILVR